MNDNGPPWPEQPHPAAFHGVAGDIVRAIEPHTEADPVAILIQILVMYGNLIGRNPYWIVERDKHYANLFVALVGETSRGRKGTSLGHARHLASSVDSEWASNRIQAGLSSGEGLLSEVRDPIVKKVTEKGAKGEPDTELEVVVDEGVKDKRLLVVESEFASTLRVLKRETNILSPLLRQAWDTGRMQTMTKNSPLKARGAHISLVGHVTKDELLRTIDSTEYGNGFANRFLWICVRRSKHLPEGGRIHEVDFGPMVKRLSGAVEFARHMGVVERDHEAAALWREIYEELSAERKGLLGAVTSRSEAQTMRLAMIYALLDCSEFIAREHLLAALALWEYSDCSARFIFGNSLGHPLADEILLALRRNKDGLARTTIRDLLGRHKSHAVINVALEFLAKNGLAKMELRPTGGRPAEVWFAPQPCDQRSESVILRSLSSVMSHPTKVSDESIPPLRQKRHNPNPSKTNYHIPNKRDSSMREEVLESTPAVATKAIKATKAPQTAHPCDKSDKSDKSPSEELDVFAEFFGEPQ